jgi:gluconolactonase
MASFLRYAGWVSLPAVFACSDGTDDALVQQTMAPARPAASNPSATSGMADGSQAAAAPQAAGNDEAPPVNAPLQGTTPASGGSGTGATPPAPPSAADDGVDMAMPTAVAPAPVLTTNGCPAGPFPANPVPAGATAQPVCTGMTFTEGAVWFAERNTLFFSDIVAGSGSIMSFTPGASCQEFIANAGTNGLAIAADGNLLAARQSDRTITLFNLMTQQPSVLVADNGGLAFNSPNDVALRSDGNLYFTDPNYGGGMPQQPARAYRRDPSGELTVIDEGGNSNGITLSPDESRLYLSHLGNPNNVLVFDVDASGALSNSQPFVANVGSDGMGVDCAGNLYLTQGGVRIYSPDGTQIGMIPAQGAANIAFGGPERKTLYITARASLLALELAIPGLPY